MSAMASAITVPDVPLEINNTSLAVETTTQAKQLADETTEDVINAIRDEIIKHVDLKDKSIDDAVLELMALGLESENIKWRAKDGSFIINPFNWTVVDYEIEGGGQLTRDSVVHLICAKLDKSEEEKLEKEKKEELCSVPDVKDMDLDDAISKLKKAGFKNIDYTSNNGKSVIRESNWTVIYQNHKSGERIAADTQIVLTVAKTAAMPNVVGMDLDDAIKKLEKAGFTSINYESDNGKSILKKSNWTVKEQNYESGELVVLDDEIRLVVTK